MNAFLAKCFGTSDGRIDLSRIVMLAMAAAYIAQSGYALWKGQAFDWAAFGTGAGAIMAGGGAGVWLHGKGAS